MLLMLPVFDFASKSDEGSPKELQPHEGRPIEIACLLQVILLCFSFAGKANRQAHDSFPNFSADGARQRRLSVGRNIADDVLHSGRLAGGGDAEPQATPSPPNEPTSNRQTLKLLRALDLGKGPVEGAKRQVSGLTGHLKHQAVRKA